ncbi:MAG TPA: hypothetical protein VFD77_05040 [Brumimicrobium sp.]|nr:hypothetical protein [Brumimicrobium sp.]
MKLKSCSILSLILVCFLSSNITLAQSIFKNDIFLQPYIGGPNIKQWAFDGAKDNNQSVKGVLHYGLSGEIVISPNFGIGFDAIYSPFSRSEKYQYTHQDPITGEFSTLTNEEVFTSNKLRLIAKAYIHFNVSNPLWDIYISGGFGANILFNKYELNGEKLDYSSNVYWDEDFPIISTGFPISGRFCFGTRYFITDYFGVNFEAGIGGPPFSLGVNLRL